jgi:hypothetical protein
LDIDRFHATNQALQLNRCIITHPERTKASITSHTSHEKLSPKIDELSKQSSWINPRRKDLPYLPQDRLNIALENGP